MKRKIKSYVLNMHVVGAFSVLFICVSLISCDYWFARDDDYDVQLGGLYAGNDALAPNRKLFFTSPPTKENLIEKNLVAFDIGGPPSKGNDQHIEP